MKRMNGYLFVWLSVSISLVPVFSTAQEIEGPSPGKTDLREMDLEELLQVKIELASKRLEPISTAPAVATVITAEEIKAMGATTLDEILQTVSGIHVLRSSVFYSPVYSIRGIYHEALSSTDLLMINGVPMRDLIYGKPVMRRDLPVNSISRIEIIRGPGSALHGADAISGVIDIHTKSYDDIENTEVGARIGTFNTRDAWLGIRGEWKGFKSAFLVDYHETEGFKKNVPSDLQTEFDTLFGSNATLTPGKTETEAHALDLRVDIEKGKWHFRGGYQRFWDYGTGIGVAQSLDPVGRVNGEIFMADLFYQNPKLAEDIELSAVIRYDHQKSFIDPPFLLFPPGATFPSGTFPEGVIGRPRGYQQNTQFELSTLYSGLRNHELRLGTGFFYGEVHNTSDTTNFTIDESTFLPIPRGALIDVPESELFLTERVRKSFFVYLQDQWQVFENWALTLGMRHDHDDVFGGATNPRAGLVWQTTKSMTTKLLYGEAFRAPTFTETFQKNNPAVLGNPNINPEKISTTEMAFYIQASKKLNFSFSGFYYKWRDVIQYQRNPAMGPGRIAQNVGAQTGRGFEFDLHWHPKTQLDILGNFSHVNVRNKTQGERVPGVPSYQAYLRVDWNVARAWHFVPQVTWTGKRPRASNDPRPKFDDRWITDVTIRRKYRASAWEFSLIARNLFNQNMTEPSPGPETGSAIVSLPNDLPGPGRRIIGEIRYRF